MDIKKRLVIPRQTADPVAMFREVENPQEAALLEIQMDNVQYIWEAIVNRSDFQAAEFTLRDGRERILSPSTREGIDWQLSYIGSDGIANMHGDYQEDSHYNPREGHNMKELYRDLSMSHSRYTTSITLMLDENKKGENSVEKNDFLFIADMAKHYALYNRIPIAPDSEFFKAYEAANGTVDRTQYRQILTDTLFREGIPKVVILQSQENDLIFHSWNEVSKDRVQSDNYEIVYISEDLSNLAPEEIYERFNAPGARPGDYYGTSVSVGNVIAYQNGEEFSATFVDRFGFHDLPDDFLSEKTKQKIEMSIDVRKERDLLNHILGFVQEQGVELDVARDRERIAAIDQDFEAAFGLADLRVVNAQCQDMLSIIYDYQQESGMDYGIAYVDGTYYAMSQNGENGQLAAENAEDYRKEVNVRLEHVSQDKEKLYYMKKRKAVSIESTEDYTETNFHKELVNVDIQNPDGTYGRVKDYYRIVEAGERGLIPIDDRIFESYEDARVAIMENESLFLMDYDRLVGQAIAARNSRDIVPHGEDGRITLHIRYREHVNINGWTAETDTLTFDSRAELDKYINGEVAYDVLDNAVRKRENEILLYADNENGEIVWHTPEWEISSFTAYDGNVYEILDRWEDSWGQGAISLTVGRDRNEDGDFFLAVVKNAGEGETIYREYEFDEPPSRNSVYERFIDDEAMRDIDRAEARAMGINLEQEERDFMAQDEVRKTQQTEQEPTTAAETTGQDEKKTAKDELSEQLMQGVKSVMESENYKNWLATSSSYFTNNYSMRNAILIFLQKPEASYVKGYEAWKEFGRNVSQGGKGAKIFVPVMAYDKTEGQLFRMVTSNLNEQIKANPEQIAVYRLGISSIEFTMNRSRQVGLRVNGKERTIFPNQQEVKKFISSAILGKVPMYYTVGTVFDVKDTIVPEHLWVKKGYTKDEVVKDENGKPIKNRKGEIKIFNTPERQAKFRPSLEISVNDPKDPAKMAILYDALKTVSARNGVPVTDVARGNDETLSGGADGYFSRQFTPENPKGFIIMPDDLEPTRKVATLLHEMGHSDLHGNLERLAEQMGEKKISGEMREIQAESVAYATARQFGIETDTNSFKYLAAYTQGFDMQNMEKSLDVIYKECKKLTQEIAAELDARGLNLDLTEKENEPMNRETVETLCKQYTAYALEQSDTVSSQMKELPALAADNRNSPELLDVVTAQKKCMDRQLGTVDAIHADVKTLEKATTRDEQTAALERLEASKRNLEGEKMGFADLVTSFAEISSQSKVTLKEEFSRDPLATLESMKQDFPKLESLSSMQLAYVAKSDYIKRQYGNFLKNAPTVFVNHVCERAAALDKAVSKNGTFVEVNFCEQWTDKTIVQSGAIMHPKIADSVVKQAEVQIRGLKAEAEKNGDYFPYNKCDLTVFSKSGHDLTAFHTRVDIGDGAQTSLSEHLTQLCGEGSDLVASFEKATREKGAKEKVVFNEKNPVPEKTEVGEPVQKASTREEWDTAIAQEKSGAIKEEQNAEAPEKSKEKDNKEH